jgi:UTP--glucose-1-phosphate uridylyltransferase
LLMKVKKAVIPAAGLGTRMLPASKSVPKEMLTVAQKPAIQYLVEEAAASGIEEILIIVSRGKSVLEDHFDYFPELEQRLILSGRVDLAADVRKIADLCEITFVRQKELLGLGHAISCAKSFTKDDPFCVMLGDDLIYTGDGKTASSQLISVYNEFGESVVGVQEVSPDAIHLYGSIKPDNSEKKVMRVLDMVEKPSKEEAPSYFAALGRYVLTPEIYDEIEKKPEKEGKEIQITDALRALAKKGSLYACDFDGVRYDTGNLLGYLKASVEYGLRSECGEGFKEYLKGLLRGI